MVDPPLKKIKKYYSEKESIKVVVVVERSKLLKTGKKNAAAGKTGVEKQLRISAAFNSCFFPVTKP